ncbi:MAG: phosphoribosylaminoimidazolecarboxamide formyltransferase/IMP cyclohydrolase [Gammaproteobacteria bacterium]|jgi:phosphoribosylaminoimidazolecarboxamide formyltransferase/IMP cyclohydrolase|nr:phosphoribosylaminoimidazolecarboxamide formyltransferase/IMP cyclohydrolase [Gammaproteobacteria bacterium]
MTEFPVKTALISVSDKSGLLEFAKNLQSLGIKIISTGGTAETLKNAGIAVSFVSELTGYPELMEGRLKTLHPKIHGGILGKRDEHALEAKQHEIEWIDLVVVNLYPFAKKVQAQAPYHEIIENIDIGGPAMIRSAAKNMNWVSVIVDPKDYASTIDELKHNKVISLASRKKLAAKAFAHTACYDALIAEYLNQEKFPQKLSLSFELQELLRYGENPQQQAAIYHHPYKESCLLAAKQLQGKTLSYNNFVDAEAAFSCVLEFDKPACVIVKHANPCAVAAAAHINEAFNQAWQADSQSAFGGIIALNRVCTKAIAAFLNTVFIEVIIAPAFEPDACDILSAKPNYRLLALADIAAPKPALVYKFIAGGLLVQDRDMQSIAADDLKVVTAVKPDAREIQELLFAWKVVKHLKSNAIAVTENQSTLGLGCGQVSRIDAVKMAIEKAGKNLQKAVLASDGFFPFRDNIDVIAKAGIKAIIQPGGSIKDQEIIQACDEYGIGMLLTGVRCFNH